MRTRERVKEEIEQKDEEEEDDMKENDELKEILSATLNALHSHIFHQKALFRLENKDKDSHFVTSKDENEKKEDSILSIKFGVNVLEWLDYNEKPSFNSFRDEIIGNAKSKVGPTMFYKNDK